MNHQRTAWRLRCGACLWCGLIAVAASGCSSSGEGGVKRDRATAYGKAEFDGQAIPAGAVVFTHLDSGTVVSCPITKGKYQNERDSLVVVGKNAVSVIGMDQVDGKPLWNGAWSKQVDVSGSKFAQDFNVVTSELKSFTRKKEISEEDRKEEEPLWKK